MECYLKKINLKNSSWVSTMVKVRENLIGKKFGKLTVIEQADDYVDSHGNHVARWLCECDCEEHNKIIVKGSALKNKNTQSCGCLFKEVLIQNNKKLKKKYNEYDLSGEYGIGWTTNTKKEFYFDLEDYDKIKNYAWRERVSNNGKYHALVARDKETKKMVLMSNLLGYKHYDHKDRNPLNNRKENLRKATYSQNAQNRTVGSNNTSGIIGVHYSKSAQKWRAVIKLNGKHNHLGYFVNKDEAIKTRLKAEVEYFGEFSPQKHLFKQYGINAKKDGDIDE